MSESVTKESLVEMQYPPSILEDVAKLSQRVQTFTGATGAALALREGEDMVCRASRGNNAPDVGMMLSLDGTFTGLAVTGMKAVRCDDTENDPRVDPEISRSLRIKSMAVVPVLSGMRVTGVIAVFSGMNNAFSDTHMAVLKTMADGLGANVLRWMESQGINMAPPATAASTLKSQLSPISAIPSTSEQVTSPKVEATKSALEVPTAKGASAAQAAPTAMAAAAAPAFEKPAPPKKQETKQQGKWKPVAPKLEEAAVIEAKPAKTEPKPEPKAVPAPSFSYETAEEPEGKKSPVLIGGIAAAVLLVAVGGYFMFGRSSKPAAPATTTAVTQPAPSTSSAPAPAASATVAVPAAATNTSKTDSAKPAATDKPKSTAVADTTTSVRPAPSPIVVAPAASSLSKSADIAPPTLALGAGSGPTVSVPMTTSAPKLASPAPANAVVVPSHLVHRVDPVYPPAAKQYRVEGAVTLDATIAADGHVKDAKIVSGPSLLRDAAANAVRQWKYSPSTVNGRPVESSVQVVLKFILP